MWKVDSSQRRVFSRSALNQKVIWKLAHSKLKMHYHTIMLAKANDCGFGIRLVMVILADLNIESDICKLLARLALYIAIFVAWTKETLNSYYYSLSKGSKARGAYRCRRFKDLSEIGSGFCISPAE